MRRLLRCFPKARWLVAVWVGAELLALPAAAHVVGETQPPDLRDVTAVRIPLDTPGESAFIVVADGPFTVRAQGVSGRVTIAIERSGAFGNARFGDAAQLPGPSETCAVVYGASGDVYVAERGTLTGEARGRDAAVVMTFRHSAAARPEFVFEPGADPASVSACAA